MQEDLSLSRADGRGRSMEGIAEVWKVGSAGYGHRILKIGSIFGHMRRLKEGRKF